MSDSNIKAAKDALTRAKFGMMYKQGTAFLTSIIFDLKVSYSDKISSIGTDGLRLVVNPDWWLQWNDKQRLGVLAHEGWHVAFMHSYRRGNRNPELWNFAGDILINNMLIKNGMELPPGLWNETTGLNFGTDVTTEEIYDKLVEMAQSLPKPQNEFGMDMLDPSDGDEEGEDGSPSKAQAEQQVKQSVVKAHTVAKMQNETKGWGTESAELDRLINDLVNPRVPWNVVLRNLMFTLDQQDFSNRKFNRRFLPDYYMPTLYSESIGEINAYVDASGSVSQNDFTIFLSEINGIKQLMKPKRLNIITFDTRLMEEVSLEPYDEVAHVKLRGGGGTDITPVVQHIEQTRPDISIIFTDGYFSERDYAKSGQSTHLFWLIYDNPRRDFSHGRVIHWDKD